MIELYINEPTFEYDVYHLLKAFFPLEEITVVSAKTPDSYAVEYKDKTLSFAKGDYYVSEEISSDLDRPEFKNRLKATLYKALSQETGQTLAWGDLSGIRPTKIPRTLLEEGKSETEVLSFLKDTYFVSDKKAKLSLEIAKREREILSKINTKTGYSIYIGIPFCPSTCLYCSFTSNPISKFKSKVNDYLACIEKELAFVSGQRSNQTLDTIYIGGGTPTSLNEEELDTLFAIVDRYYDVTKLLEYTVEAGRADSITLDKLKVLKKHHVTRISVNPQTMHQETLDIIGRHHTVEDVKRAFKDARAVGFTNINMDIILGLPGEDSQKVKETIDEIVKLSPDALTVHSLAIKRASRMQEWILKNGYETMINTEETMEIAQSGALSMNMVPYYLYRQKNMAGNFENTGYSKEGCFGIYNILIMEDVEPIIALGAGSVSKVFDANGKAVRDDNVKDVLLYIEKIDEMIERKRKLFSLEQR